jgi:hypothetical protein
MESISAVRPFLENEMSDANREHYCFTKFDLEFRCDRNFKK